MNIRFQVWLFHVWVAAVTTWTGWAMSSITSKLYKSRGAGSSQGAASSDVKSQGRGKQRAGGGERSDGERRATGQREEREEKEKEEDGGHDDTGEGWDDEQWDVRVCSYLVL